MLSPEITIRKAVLSDAGALSNISAVTFHETFAAQNTKEDMELFINECFNVEALRTELKDEKTQYFMGFINHELVGYCKICEAGRKEFDTKRSLEIARIYVLKEHHSKKIGAALMHYVLDLAKKNKFEVVWLGVWE